MKNSTIWASFGTIPLLQLNQRCQNTDLQQIVFHTATMSENEVVYKLNYNDHLPCCRAASHCVRTWSSGCDWCCVGTQTNVEDHRTAALDDCCASNSLNRSSQWRSVSDLALSFNSLLLLLWQWRNYCSCRLCSVGAEPSRNYFATGKQCSTTKWHLVFSKVGRKI